MTRRNSPYVVLPAFALAAAGSAMARVGGGNHTALGVNLGSGHASASSSGGGAISLGGIIVLIVLALLVRFIYRRMVRRAPQVPATLAALSASLGASPPPPDAALQTSIEAIRAGDPG